MDTILKLVLLFCFLSIVTCKDLHLLKADVGTVEGLDITAYDKAVSLIELPSLHHFA